MDYTIKDGTRPGALEIYFEGKPGAGIRESLKSLKMRWNGSKLCWYGFVTEEAIKNALNGAEAQEAPKTEALNDYYVVPTDGYLGMPGFKGSNCKHLYGAELSKAIREAFKRCNIKGVTVSVKTFSGGQELHLKIKANNGDMVDKETYVNNYEIPNGWIYYGKSECIYYEKFYSLSGEEQKAIKEQAANYSYEKTLESMADNYGATINKYYIEKDNRFTDQFKKRFAVIHQIVNSFNHDESNSMVDYFNRGFYDDYYIKA